MKTIREHLETLPEPWRTQALENTKEVGNLNLKKPTLKEAIAHGFWWDDTKEKEKYWEDLFDRTEGNVVGESLQSIAFLLMSRLEAHQTSCCTCGVPECPRCAVYEGDLAVINQYKALPESSR